MKEELLHKKSMEETHLKTSFWHSILNGVYVCVYM